MKILFILYIVCKLSLIFLSWRSLFLLEKLLGIIFLCVCLWHVIAKKINVKKGLAALLVLALLFVPNNLQMQKFLILKDVYQNKAEEIIADMQGDEYGFSEQYKLNLIDRFVLNNFDDSVKVEQNDGHYVVSFQKDITFFSLYSFSYISDEDALDLIYHPSKYQKGLADREPDLFEWLDDEHHWALIKWY